MTCNEAHVTGYEAAVAYFPDYGSAGTTACYVDCDENERQLAGTKFSTAGKLRWTWDLLLLSSGLAVFVAI